MNKVFLSVLLGTTFLCSCGTQNKSVVDLAGEWNIITVEGQKVSSEEIPFLGFDVKENRMYGNAGCNNIMGSVALNSKKGSIELSNVGATRRMCPDMKLEDKVLNALEKVKSYKATKKGVELTDAEGKVLFGLEKKQAPAVTVADLNGEWIITTVGDKAVEVVEKTPFIAFNVEEKKVHGTGGCNIFNGGFIQDTKNPTALRFSQMALTRMAGPGMKNEGIILSALEKVRSFAFNADGTVSMNDRNNKTVFVMKKNTGKSLSE